MTEYVRHPVQPESVDIRLVDGVFVKATTFRDAGMVIPQHSHEFDHLSAITSGAVAVEADGELLGRFEAPAFLVIKARTKHLFTTLMPNTTVMCIHNADRLERDEVVLHEEHHLVEPN